MALSPAVNAPTTAVQVIDYLGATLRQIGTTPWVTRAEGDAEHRASAVVMRAYRWEDFVALGVTEIREYGASSIQVLRRLRAMLEELREAVLSANRMAVEGELTRLDATVAERWGTSIDLDRASIADVQGIGGPGALGKASTRA